MSKYTLILDSSQISAFLECPQRWFDLYYLRLVPTGLPETNEPMNAGTYGHKLFELFYKARCNSVNFNDSIEQAFAYDPDKDTCECGCHLNNHKALPVLKLEECQKCHKCLNFKPHPFALSLDVRQRVRNRFTDYVTKYRSNDFIPLSEAHVEVGFSEPIYEDIENLFILEGRLDLIGTLQGLKCIADHKFQMQSHWLYPASIQFKNYCMIAGCPMLIINYVRLQKQIQPDSLTREIVTFSPPQLQAWKKKLISIYFNIKDTLLNVEAGGTPEQNWNSCKGYGKTYSKDQPKYCQYTQLCEESSPLMRQRRIDQLYKVKTIEWRPW